ncbi:MAG: hypothetical protein EWV53_15730 [Microcystis panniformis Mp_MB_F_20051200_S9]|uniref:Uncharacterized protein n=1 Tax=Microcystis panniformis Mp_MB_F_20051200_S9 TaxID=2486223 RepID=A0A552PSH1_9CHRO|nr:MAG: hypothetical protein EWV43_17295 [Microcystis panniformis Mp_MB_F_20080800_S26D]TRV48335.1 MAG: hypothetical protein EWV42_14815 [Microcystis panniformis Mp_GB_SS_20050300_S99D]TRV50590.1 MAG: hypothetical protein EWV87_08225 [Microcystis panniformis Mp_GB_SS_20050300_S99]TRV55849.1 MAG: hypothetical protein EWV69_19450 [Microcystis panniformis Mp_MB_F_20080800_S26]TRV59667.1 MAG: hypothetical protein EWV86_17605 [Microcystis panniformis Mp_MB_F_20051200_S9D]TRV59922.1 MAG: hypothetica
MTGDIRITWHINKTSCKNQKLLLGLGVRSQESGELRMNNKQLNALSTDFMPFNPYSCRFETSKINYARGL